MRRLEFERNRERYELLRWGQASFNNFSVIPPASGICHQVNLEYIGTVVQTKEAGGGSGDGKSDGGGTGSGKPDGGESDSGKPAMAANRAGGASPISTPASAPIRTLR